MKKNSRADDAKEFKLLDGRIEALADILPDSERKLAELLTARPALLATHSATELAALAGSSKAAVTRFIQRIGYQSFANARREAREGQWQGSPAFQYAPNLSGIADEFVGKHLQCDLANIARTFERLNPETLAQAINAIVRSRRIAIIGYCFGGLCALDVARSGAPEIKGAVSFHGVYAPNGLAAQPITAKVLVLDGYRDPLCPPEAKAALMAELEAGGADWQFLSYGRTYHAFTNRGAANAAGGMEFNADTDRRSWTAMTNFLAEVLA